MEMIAAPNAWLWERTNLRPILMVFFQRSPLIGPEKGWRIFREMHYKLHWRWLEACALQSIINIIKVTQITWTPSYQRKSENNIHRLKDQTRSFCLPAHHPVCQKRKWSNTFPPWWWIFGHFEPYQTSSLDMRHVHMFPRGSLQR